MAETERARPDIDLDALAADVDLEDDVDFEEVGRPISSLLLCEGSRADAGMLRAGARCRGDG